MENFKRSVKRLITRLTILGLVVICGAIAIAQAQKDRNGAIASAPDLSEPAAAAVTENNAEQRLAAVTIAAEPMGFGEPQSRQAESDQTYIRDEQVTTAQALEQFPNRFAEPFRGEPPAENPSGNRFAVAQADAPVIPKFRADGLEPPELLSNDEGSAPSVDAPLPAADTTLPPFPAPAGQNNFNNFNDFPSNSGPPPRQPPAGQSPASTKSDLDTTDRYEVEPPPVSNPMRSANPVARGPAPIGSDPPVFDSFSEPASNSPAGNAFGDVAQPPTTPPETNTVNLSGAGKPGPRDLEGPQSPSLTIQKIAPKDVRVGVQTTFQIRIRNNGQVPAERVLIRDEVPLGTQLVDTTPQATTDSSGAVLWEIGTLRPQEDVTVTMQVTPVQEGFVGSVASVTFQTLASARAEVKKPMLTVEHTTKSQVLVGDTVSFAITLENPGTGPARDIVIEEDVPSGLSHSKGPKLEYEVGTIPAGGQRRLELSLKAAEPGMVDNVIVARGAGGLIAEHRLQLEVIAPQLQVKVKGPSRRYLERNATFTLAIENPGTAPARNVELVTRLPQGLKFVSTNNSGRYDASTNTIRWNLDRLPPRQFGEVKFTAVPVQKGDFNINAVATANTGLRDAQDHSLVVEGIAALLLEVADQVDPIEVGGVTTYNIRVKNQGTEEANNVRFVATVPPGMRAVDATGPTGYQIQGNRVLFESIARLPAKGDSTYKVRVEGIQKGDKRFKVEMKSGGANATPVIEEESTMVYDD